MKAFLQKKTIKAINAHGELVAMVVLLPHDEATQKYVGRRSDGQVLVTDIKQARSYPNHKRMFKFLTTSFDLQEFYTDIEVYRNWITVASGHFNIIVYPDGMTELIPKSWAFENMPEDDFRKLFKSAIGAFLEEFGQGMTDAEFMRIIDYE